MADSDDARDTKPADSGMRLSWGLRFSPQVIVVLITLWAAIAPLRGAIVSGVNAWWGRSYARVNFVMDEARPNDGYPYIAGHLEGSAAQVNLPGDTRGGTIVVKAAPKEAFAAGKRITLWHSAEAPNFVVFGQDVNDVPVAALPERPGWAAFLGYLAWLVATLVVGFGVMIWVANRWSANYGNLRIRGSGRSMRN